MYLTVLAKYTVSSRREEKITFQLVQEEPSSQIRTPPATPAQPPPPTQLTTKEVLIFPLHHTHSGSKGQLAVCCLSSCPVLSISKSEMLSHSLCGIYIYKPYGCRPTPLGPITQGFLEVVCGLHFIIIIIID